MGGQAQRMAAKASTAKSRTRQLVFVQSCRRTDGHQHKHHLRIVVGIAQRSHGAPIGI